MSHVKNPDSKELSQLLARALLKNEGYLEALDVVKKNSRGKIWLIGGGVYKTLLNLLYGDNFKTKDWDFIAERLVEAPRFECWEVMKSGFGNPKLKKGDFYVDLVPLDNIHSIKERGLEPNIDNYLSGTPLTIQSIAFDVDEHSILGEVGLRSVLTRTVGVNNRAAHECARTMYPAHYELSRWAEALGLMEE